MKEKLKYSIGLIERALSENGISKEKKGVLAFSGGIDSTCVLNLPPILTAVKEGSIQLLFCNTLVEFKETLDFVKDVKKGTNAELIITTPIKTFKQIIEEYGFPIYPRSSKDKNKARAVKRCCDYLKKKPFEKALKTHKWTLQFTGLRSEESRTRKLSIMHNGDYFLSKTENIMKCHSIAHWTLNDIWDFQRAEGFKYNKLYDMVTYLNDKEPDFLLENTEKFIVRTGCWCCPQGIRRGYLKWLREHFPKMFYLLMIKMGLAEQILDMRIDKNMNVKSKKALLMRDISYKEIFGVERALELHPCYFDKM